MYAGHDEAAEQQKGGFEMRDYQIFATDDPTSRSGDWDLYADNLDPDEVFSWATGDAAFAGQVTTGADGKFYWYAPVQWENTAVPNRRGDRRRGRRLTRRAVDRRGQHALLTWTDVFGSSTTGQEVIDPHVFTDTDGSVYLYWGSWSVARVVKALVVDDGAGRHDPDGPGAHRLLRGALGVRALGHLLHGLRLEAGRVSVHAVETTRRASPTRRHRRRSARGRTRGSSSAASATTVHPSIVEHEGRWWITYHTKDAVGEAGTSAGPSRSTRCAGTVTGSCPCSRRSPTTPTSG